MFMFQKKNKKSTLSTASNVLCPLYYNSGFCVYIKHRLEGCTTCNSVEIKTFTLGGMCTAVCVLVVENKASGVKGMRTNQPEKFDCSLYVYIYIYIISYIPNLSRISEMTKRPHWF